MREAKDTQGASAGVGWEVWAAGIVPAMVILPMYVFPLPFLRVGAYGGRRLLEILWATGLLLAFLRPSIRDAAAAVWLDLDRTTRLAAGSLVGAGFLSAVLSSSPAYSLREWSLITLLLIVAMPLGAILANRRAKVLEVVALTLLLYAILIGATPLETGFAHPRFQGQALAVVVPPALFSGNPVLALIAAPALALGVLNGSRALMLTLVVVTGAAWILWSDRRNRMVLPLASLALTAVLVFVASSLGAGSSLGDAVQRGTSSMGRGAMWLESFERFLRAPLLGEGPGMLARAPGVIGFAAHPHNSVMLVAAELGIAGLLALAVLLAQAGRRIRSLGHDRRPWALALIGGGFHSLFSGTVLMPAAQSFIVLALALVLPASWESTRHHDTHRRSARTAGWVLAFIGAVALAILLPTLALPPAELSGSIPGPRFFQRGIIP